MKLEPIYSRVATRVSKARVARGWSQSELARAIGVTRACIANMEAGRQRIMLHQLAAVAKVLRCSLVKLV